MVGVTTEKLRKYNNIQPSISTHYPHKAKFTPINP